MTEAILVIATAGIGRFVAALGALGALRAYHSAASVVLLTAPITAGFASTAPYFDEVWSDGTCERWDVASILNLRRKLRLGQFTRVYDLDHDRHSTLLFRLMHGWPAASKKAQIPWSGVIGGTALAYTDTRRDAMHLVDRWTAQLRIAGVGGVLRPDLSWVARQVKSFSLPFRMNEPFVLLALTPEHADWGASHFSDLAMTLAADGQRPVLIGDGPPEMVQTILEQCPAAVDLTGRATLNEVVLLAWAATAAVGPDNGLTHLTSAAGCRTIVLYDSSSDPALVGQRGAAVTILRRPRLSEIAAGEVMAVLKARSPSGTRRP
jgi:ADP-heptose:LPS heptosyltransferase